MSQQGPAAPPASSGLKGMGRIVLINLGILALYVIPGILGVSLGADGGSEVAMVIAFFGPLVHSAIAIVAGLVLLIVGTNKNLGAGLMISGMLVGLIGFSTCVGLISGLGR